MNRWVWVVALALASAAFAQGRLGIVELLQRWSKEPTAAPPRLLHSLAEQVKRAQAGERAAARDAVIAAYRQNPATFRDLLEVRRPFRPTGTESQIAAHLRFTLGVGFMGLVELFEHPPDIVLERLRGFQFGWPMRVKRFDQALDAQDWVAADRDFTLLSRAMCDLYDAEVQRVVPRASPKPVPVASPTPAPSATPAPAPSASAAPPRGPDAGANRPATWREKAARAFRGLLSLGLLALGVGWYRRRGAPLDLTGPLGLLARGQPDAALKALQATLPAAGGAAPEVRAHMIRCMVRSGQIELAMKLYGELPAERVPHRALFLLGRDFEDRAQTKVALELYARVFLANADFEDVRERYDKLRAQSGLSAAILSPADIAARLPARYTRADLIGHGGMGLVMKATDTQTSSEVALKVIAPAVASDAAFVTRFKREIRALTALDHPAIIKVLDSAVAPFPFYAMELLSGDTLGRIGRQGPVAEKRACALVVQAAEGLACAHAKGVVHRDVKPDNIMVEAGDRVKLLDFGLAHIAGATSLTQTGITAGSAPYMSPEQLRGEPTGAATDVYALGLVLYQLLAGRPAFGTAQPMVRLVQEPEPVSGVTPALSALVARCTAAHPDDRPSMSELAEGLKKFL